MLSAPLILCVDDDALVLNMTRQLLESAGYRVISAHTGAEALRQSAAAHIDAAVLDYSMPEMDGPELAAALRARNSHFPIIFFTGSPDRVGEADMGMADACVEKGGPLFALTEALRVLLQRKSRRNFVRYRVVAPVGVRVYGGVSSDTLMGRSIDVGEGGLGGRLDAALVPGQVVSMTIQLPNLARQISSAARVAYRHGERHGFQFLALAEAEREAIRATFTRQP